MSGKSGLTLIELAIVLLIIGLIAGGILVGAEMIKTAEVRATIAQVEKYQTAVNTFKGKYGVLPGDMLPTQAQEFGFARYYFHDPVGNNNGVLEGDINVFPSPNSIDCEHYDWIGWPSACGEHLMFWRHLSDAQLVDGYYGRDGIIDTGGARPAVGCRGGECSMFFPPSKLGNGIFVMVFSLNGYNFYRLARIGGVAAGDGIDARDDVPENWAVTPGQAYAIDSKLDDGYPETGQVTALDFNNSCFDTGSPRAYLLSLAIIDVPGCKLSLRFH